MSAGDLGYSTQSGKVRSDGFEFEAHVDMWKNLMVVAAVSTQKLRDDSTGKPLIQSGRGNASLFTFYTLPSGPAKGFGLRYAARAYSGQTAGGESRIPQYTVFDSSLRYDLANLSPALKGWKVSAAVHNLFDKRYVANCYGFASSDAWCCRRGIPASFRC